MVAAEDNLEALELRSRPRPVTRLNKKALLIATGGAALLIFGAVSVALKPPRAVGEARAEELYNVETKPTAEGLEALPKSYADVKPQLGKPLPGDLGAALLKAEQAVSSSDVGGDPYDYAAMSPTPFRNSPEADAAREAALREAQIKAEAREAGVFFQLASRGQSNSPSAGSETPPVSPFDLGLVAAPPAFGAERGDDPNRQIRKMQFLEDPDLSATDNPHRIEDQITPFEVMAGTVIPASLITGVNSDLPGTVIAQVTQNVRDTVTGQYVLIPQGSRLIGRYDSVIAFGQSRALLVWTRIVYPDGGSIVIDNMPASDVAGYAGLSDKVDFHTFRLLKGIILSTLLGVGTELSFDDSESDLVAALRESTQNSANQAGQRIVERNLDIQPTIKIRPGWPLRVIVHKDLVLRPYNLEEAAR
ncbi:TrbI/VirB10 family protein [Hyphococcus luteus]|uniref:Conjugal transfer protein TraI n=1 Tax=Hyphococcus luteus TaxID=2058213 RepID=A0A2S7K9V8_9PROT|nr:TrbI/VirB10 family protein [Marinicaulis flavus]PQA89229.1 conjugal transfer protein TraI [Marinicaulis flavus]